jgi:hypothetical protein|tara:strand:+ start:1062 stop:3638 length:2577 start_codon:yes stop_codon:yes gene_type:complete
MNRPALALPVAAFVGLGAASLSADTYTPGEPVHGKFENFAEGFLANHCYDCHDGETKKGDLNLLDLGPVDETNAAVWKSVWAQVSLQEMPPKKKERPEVIARLRFADWIVNELQRVMEDKGGFQAHLDPHKGNFVDHDLLFGPLPDGIKLAPTSSPARIWRVTPQEHITRLNELINTEPQFDTKKPGLRTRGDVVPTNHGGELKLYFGADRIIKWQGGTVAYATSVKSIPVVLSSGRKHGFENYPSFYTVNSAEATQILGKAEDILRYMAYGPLSIANPEQITDDPKTYAPEGDLRGLPTAITYSTKVVRPMTPVYELMKNPGVTDESLRAAVDYLFEALTFRPPSQTESYDYLDIVKNSIDTVGKENGVFLGLSSIFLDRDALFRPELVETNKSDKHGRVMLQDWELGLAVNHALRYIKPDEELRQAITDGSMRTRADVEREVTRMLADDSIRKPRILRFFKDYFDHDLAGYICKDDKALATTGVSSRGNAHYRAMFNTAASTDRLIELILEQDKDVLKELLITQQVVATRADNSYFGRKRTPEEKGTVQAAKKKADAELAKRVAADLKPIKAKLAQIETKLKKMKDHPENKQTLKLLTKQKKELAAAKKKIEENKKRNRDNSNIAVAEAKLAGPKIYSRVSHRSFGNGSMKPERTLATAPEGQRLGLLTHPSWLVSHSDAMDNHAILRGRWIRERLLGGGIPDVPITVDAMLPDEPQTPLRERMRVTREKYCWTCHKKMDPLGLPFEMYNHAGLFRTTELNEPVDTSGEIIDSGDPQLDGPVKNAIEMIQKLAESERVEQVFVRHAFRFWTGRNETLNDAPALQDAHRAYRDGGGSMNALIASLVTSDAFLYRKVE